jgi:putative holliday junction resolvase
VINVLDVEELLGLDIGEKRVGVARIHRRVMIAEPLAVLQNDTSLVENIRKLVSTYGSQAVVVGLPRNMSGEKTAQSQYVENISAQLMREIELPFIFQDETLSTVAATERMKSLSKRAAKRQKLGDDAYAAAVILEDYCR